MAGTDRRSRLGPAASADIGQRNYFCLASPVTSVTANAREQRRNKVGNRDRKPCVELKRGSDEIGLQPNLVAASFQFDTGFAISVPNFVPPLFPSIRSNRCHRRCQTEIVPLANVR